MGGSWSNNNSNNRNISRRRHSYHEHYPPPPYYYYSSQPQPLMPQPQPPQGYFPSPHHQYYSNGYTPTNSMLPQPHHPFYATTNTQPLDVDVNVVQALPPPPPYTDHETAKKVRNDVNLHKHTLQLYQDPNNPDHHLISFVFDALFPGRSVF